METITTTMADRWNSWILSIEEGQTPSDILRNYRLVKVLGDKATIVAPAGVNGYLWIFPDDSRLIITELRVTAMKSGVQL